MRQGKNRQKPEEQSHIPGRLNLLFFIVFILFVTLILRLAYLQIINGESYQALVDRTDETIATGNVPRGEIYDASSRPLVANDSKSTITYTRGPNVSSEDMAEVAVNLSRYITMPHTTEFDQDSGYDLSIRDLKDFFIALNIDEVNDRLSDEELELSGSEAYDAQLAVVSEDELAQFNDQQLTAAAIFKEMNSAYALSTINIKNEEVTDEEIALVSENNSELPGVSTGVDWVRTYPQEGLLRSVLGSVSSEDEGVPSDMTDYYLANGYSLNDRVGVSYLEEEYESVLKGAKSQSFIEVNQDGEIVNQTEQYPGEKGSNLILNIDAGFQATVEQIAIEYLQDNQMGLNDSIYITAVDPNNGDVLALVGKEINLSNGEITDDALGTFTKAFEMGSSVKGATVASGMMDGVLDSSNNVMVDERLQIAGTPPISSVFNRSGSVAVNDITALENSSNIYMAKLAMRMGGIWEFENGDSLNMDATTVIDKFRYYFSQFGLGVSTGIDLPGEQVGYKGQVTTPGQALYYSFGQFDSYTPIQLAQYMSTIASDGTRYALNVVGEIRGTAENGGLGELIMQSNPEILNVLNISEEELDRIQQGLYEVINGSDGTARNFFRNTSYEAAGKTGTAEALYFGENESMRGSSVTNRTFAGYAPFDNPEIAISVVVPYMPDDNTNYELNNVARSVFDAHFRDGEYEDLNETISEEYPVEGVETEEETSEGEESSEEETSE